MKNDEKKWKIKFTYEDGEIYEGEFLNKLKHGKGKNIYINGDVYEGKYYEDKKQGKNYVIWEWR